MSPTFIKNRSILKLNFRIYTNLGYKCYATWTNYCLVRHNVTPESTDLRYFFTLILCFVYKFNGEINSVIYKYETNLDTLLAIEEKMNNIKIPSLTDNDNDDPIPNTPDKCNNKNDSGENEVHVTNNTTLNENVMCYVPRRSARQQATKNTTTEKNKRELSKETIVNVGNKAKQLKG